MQAREEELLKTYQATAKTLRGATDADAAPSSLPMPGVLGVEDAMLDEVIGTTVMEVLSALSMEPGEEQAVALKQILGRYELGAQASSKGDGGAPGATPQAQGGGAGAGDTALQAVFSPEEEAAAVKIQAQARGMMVRKTSKVRRRPMVLCSGRAMPEA